MFDKKKVAVIVAEFLGTAVLTLVVLSVSRSTIGIPYFVALAAGLAIAGGTLIFRPISGAKFNPAIVLALWSARRIKTVTAIVYVAAELLGGIAAYMLYRYFVSTSWQNSGHYSGHVLVAESVGTFILGLAWAVVSYTKPDDGKAAVILGIAMTAGILVASGSAVAILNPAVALGVRSWGWGTYVLGPVLGAVIGVNVYGLLFAPAEKAPAKKKK